MQKLPRLFAIVFVVGIAVIIAKTLKDNYEQSSDKTAPVDSPKATDSRIKETGGYKSFNSDNLSEGSVLNGGEQKQSSLDTATQSSTVSNGESKTKSTQIKDRDGDRDNLNAQDVDANGHDEQVNLDSPFPVDIVQPQEVFAVDVQSGQLVWSVDGAQYSSNDTLSRIDVSVVGDGGANHQQSFKQGETLSMTQTLADGFYNWEMVTVPSLDPQMKAQLSNARKNMTAAEQEQLMARYRTQGMLPTQAEIEANRQSGYFRIVNGAIVRDQQEQRLIK